MRIRYIGQAAGVIAGWRVFQPDDEDETIEEIGTQLCEGGLFVAVEPAVPEPPATPVESEPAHAAE